MRIRREEREKGSNGAVADMVAMVRGRVGRRWEQREGGSWGGEGVAKAA